MIVGEGYLHFEASPLSGSRRELAQLVFPLVEDASREFFRRLEHSRKGEVVVEEGSIRLRGIVHVSAVALIGYGGIRQALDYMRADGKVAAGWINEHVRDRLSLSADDIVAQRRYTPAPTRLRRLFDSVASGTLSAAEAAGRAEEIFREYDETDETVERVMRDLRRELSAIPVSEPPNEERRAPRPFPPRPVAYPGRRLSIFRDQHGAIRIVER